MFNCVLYKAAEVLFVLIDTYSISNLLSILVKRSCGVTSNLKASSRVIGSEIFYDRRKRSIAAYWEEQALYSLSGVLC